MAVLFSLLILIFSASAETDWEKECERYKTVEVPKGDDIALAADAKCDTEALYYGIGQTPNYVKARQCAFHELKTNSAAAMGGNTVLMMVYANGLGVERNIPLAMRYSCAVGGSAAEIEARMPHILGLKDGDKNFDVCNHITSGVMMGNCAHITERLSKTKREKEMETLTASWTAKDKEAFDKLKAAALEFTKKRSELEVDLSGTARTAAAIGEESTQETEFKDYLEKLNSGTAPKFSAEEADIEERKLNDIYKKIQSYNREPAGTVSPSSVKETQKAWLKYREAWIEFGHAKYPKYSKESIRGWFTQKRNHMLGALQEDLQ